MGKFNLSDHIPAKQPQVRNIEVITTEILAAKRTGGEAILTIGKGLIEAKAQLPHGEWLPWLKTRVGFPEKAAQRFMLLARKYSDPTALSDLGATKALMLLALPDDERDEFISGPHLVDGEEKTVIDMTSRELEQAIRERDEARQAAESAQADARSAEESRAKMEADMVLLREQCRTAQESVVSAQKELEELKSRPMEVAVMTVDQEKLDAARAEAVAEMQAKLDKAKAARDKAEEKRKAAEAALADANAKLEAAAKEERKDVIGADRDLAQFALLLEQTQETVNRMHGLLMKVRGREELGTAENLARALLALSERVKEAAV